MQSQRPLLITVVGPTAIGKTSRAIQIAEHYQTEIVSADSRQFFKEMTIGTAVPEPEELARVKHHFIQHLSIEDPYSVGDYEVDAIHKIEELFSRYAVVVMVGGSGLYIKAVLDGMDQFPAVEPGIREALNKKLQDQGLPYLQEELLRLDPDYYKEVDLQNPHRLIRALEICMVSGKPYSSFRKQNKAVRSFDVAMIGLEAEREIIYRRINKRVDLMMDAGLLEEARQLLPKKDLNALQTVGYKELFQYFEHDWDLERAIEEIKKNSRRYAKRQLTWFKKDERIQWFDYQAGISEVIDYLQKKTAQ